MAAAPDACTVTNNGARGSRLALRDERRGEIRRANSQPRDSRPGREEPAAGNVRTSTSPARAPWWQRRRRTSTRCGAVLGRSVTPGRCAGEQHAHYRRAQPGASMMAKSPLEVFRKLLAPAPVGLEKELRADFGRLPEEALPDLSVFAELIEFTRRREPIDAFSLT
jgi:hypothetical protein